MTIPVEHNIESWDPNAYWVEYYGGDELPSDELAMFTFCVEAMARSERRFGRMLDLGCGPTVHRLAPFVPWVEEIEVADFDPRNLRQVNAWLAGDEQALPWEKFFALTLGLERLPATAADAASREAELRQLVKRVRSCDLRDPEPLGATERFDLLTTFFCADCITTSLERWREFMAHALTLVAPGGRVLLSALGESGGYPIGDLTFPSANLTEADLRDVLAANGYDPETIHIERIQLPDEERRPYASLGHTLMATATRP